jgi:hypothetical protein
MDDVPDIDPGINFDAIADPERAMNAVKAFSVLMIHVVELDTEPLKTLSQIASSPFAQTMQPIFGSMVPEDFDKTNELIKVTLFFVEQIKTRMPENLRLIAELAEQERAKR